MRSHDRIHHRRLARLRPQRDELWAVAVDQAGKRHPQQLSFGADVVATAAAAGAIIALDHAGATAARWQLDRAVATHVLPCPFTGRHSRALTEQEATALLAAYATATEACAAANVQAVIVIDGCGLWHTALSPLGGLSGTLRAPWLRALQMLVPAAGVAMVVEDLAPQGLDLTDGILLARSLVDAGATTLWVGAGSPWLMPLWQRRKGGSTDDDRHHTLASAAALRTALPTTTIVPVLRSPLAAMERAAVYGFDSVCIEAIEDEDDKSMRMR
jgi:hypothetical protein